MSLANIEFKIEEAEYFRQRMLDVQAEIKPTTFNLSAFLAAGRSVLQYAQDDAKQAPGGETLYCDEVGANFVVRFLRDIRNIQIHRRPIEPSKSVTIEVGILGGAKVEAAQVTHQYWFPHPSLEDERCMWFHNAPKLQLVVNLCDQKDVFTLCSEYMDGVKAIVADGRTSNMLRT